jgi:hypothetical protein
MTPREAFHTSLPELDKLNREQLANLVGIASINRDSGSK